MNSIIKTNKNMNCILIDDVHEMLIDLINQPNMTLETFARVYLCNITIDTNNDEIIKAIEKRWPDGHKIISLIQNTR